MDCLLRIIYLQASAIERSRTKNPRFQNFTKLLLSKKSDEWSNKENRLDIGSATSLQQTHDSVQSKLSGNLTYSFGAKDKKGSA